MTALREQLKRAETKAYSLKTKKAQTKAWNLVRELKHNIWLKLCKERDSFEKHSIKGTVKSFRPGDDKLLVSTAYGNMWCSPTSDENSKSWYGSTCCIEYKEGQEIVIEIDVDADYDRLCLYTIPKRIYGGALNVEQYERLCKQGNLAFFKYPDGHMSGLFAKGAGF